MTAGPDWREALERDLLYYSAAEVSESPLGGDYSAKTRRVAEAFASKGVILSMYADPAFAIRAMLSENMDEAEFCRWSLKDKFLFLEKEPDAVSEWGVKYGFDAVGVDPRTGWTKKDPGSILLYARLDPAAFDFSTCAVDMDQLAGGRVLGGPGLCGCVKAAYRRDERWGLLCMVPKPDSPLPDGDYALCGSRKISELPCTAGSAAVRAGCAIPVAADARWLAVPQDATV